MEKHIWRCEKAFTAVPRDGKETAEMGKRLNIRQIMKTLFSTYLQPLFLLEAYRLIMEHLLRSFLTFPTYLKYEMKAVRDKGCSSGLSFSVSALFSVRDAVSTVSLRDAPYHLQRLSRRQTGL